MVEARAPGLRVLPRSAALASVMVGRRALAVAGTHGKTTTTSMLTVALQHCGADPSYAIGGDLNEPGSNAARRHRRRCSSPRPTRATARSSLLARRGDRHQRRGRPPRQLRHRGGLPRGVRRVRRPDRSPAASWSSAPTTPAPRALAGVARRARASTCVTVRESRRTPTCGSTDLGCAGATLAFDRGRPRAAARARSTLQVPGQHNALNALGRAGRRAAARASRRRPGRRAGGVHRRRAAVRVQGRRPAACGSSTATPTTRPRSPATCSAARAVAGEGRAGRGASSRTCSAAPGSSAPSSARRSALADEVVVHGRLRRPRGPGAGCHRRAGRRRRPAAAGAGALRAVVVRRRRRARRRAGPAGRPGAHPRRRRRHRCSARRSLGCWLERRRREAPRLHRTARIATDAAHRRFARAAVGRARLAARWRRRSVAVGARSPLVGGARSGWSTSRPRSRSGRRRSRAPDVARRRQVLGGRGRARSARRWRASTSTRSRPGRGSSPRSTTRRGDPAWPHTVRDRGRPSARRSRWSTTAARLARLDADGRASSDDVARPPPGCRASASRDRRRSDGAAARPLAVVAALPDRLSRTRSTTSRCDRRTDDHTWCCATGAPSCGGAPTTATTRPRCSRVAAAPARPGRTTSASPVSRSPRS